jgi:hypothetical protein
MTCFKPITGKLACTLCAVTFPSDKMEDWNGSVLCPHCWKIVQDAFMVQEEHTKPWDIDESLSWADFQAELLLRRRLYYDSLTAQ